MSHGIFMDEFIEVFFFPAQIPKANDFVYPQWFYYFKCK